jgi:hypothetical protein
MCTPKYGHSLSHGLFGLKRGKLVCSNKKKFVVLSQELRAELWYGSSGKAPVQQEQGPEFKPQTHTHTPRNCVQNPRAGMKAAQWRISGLWKVSKSKELVLCLFLFQGPQDLSIVP